MASFIVVRSPGESACMWEDGGASDSSGAATIIAVPDGSPKRPIYVLQGDESLSNGRHALVPISQGGLLVCASQLRGDYDVLVYRLGQPVGGGVDRVPAFLLAAFSGGEWTVEDGDNQPWSSAVQAARDKANCRDCREPHYVAPGGASGNHEWRRWVVEMLRDWAVANRCRNPGATNT